MEALYKKLYDKYKKLKEQRFSELEHVNDELEKRSREYTIAADAFIEQLKFENDELRASVKDLTEQTALLRSAKDEQYHSFQQSIMEEKQKNRQLSQEISRLQKLQEEQLDENLEVEGDAHQRTPIPLEDQSTGSETRIAGQKRPRGPASPGAASLSPPRQRQRVTESPLKALAGEKETINSADHQLVLSSAVQTQFCMRNADATGTCTCIFKALLECLIGMKVSMDKQSDRLCMSALHQSSGYSFRLTWVKEDTELLYQVSTLGTFERVAPEWMREVMRFSVSMCPLFFERVIRVIKQC